MAPEFKIGLYWSHEKRAPEDLVAKVIIQVMNGRQYVKSLGAEWRERSRRGVERAQGAES